MVEDQLARTLAREALLGDHDSFLVFKDRLEEIGDERLKRKRSEKTGRPLKPSPWLLQLEVTAEYGSAERGRQVAGDKGRDRTVKVVLDDLKMFFDTEGVMNFASTELYGVCGGLDRSGNVMFNSSDDWILWDGVGGRTIRIGFANDLEITEISSNGSIVYSRRDGGSVEEVDDPVRAREMIARMDAHEPEIRELFKRRENVLSGTGFLGKI